MRAVILAAGRGERLKPLTNQKPKVLISLLGLSLLARNILLLHSLGIQEIIVVTGYLGEKVVSEVKRENLPPDLKIQFIYNEEWEKGNGTSLYKAKKLLEKERNFLLLMGDHYFSLRGAEEFLKHTQKEEISCLWTDLQFSEGIDLDDATKVQLNKDFFLRDIGKVIKNFNGVDCGFFLLTPEIFTSLEKAFVQNKFSLTDGVRELANKNRIKGIPIEHPWQDIDTPEDLKEAKRKLLQSLRNPKDGLISRYLNRPISLKLTSLVAEKKITPTQLTLFSFSLGMFSGLLFFLQQPILAGILAQLSSIVDGMDGEIARLKFLTSKKGALLDSILDRYVDAAVICGLTFLAYVQTTTALPILLGALALSGAPLSMLFKEKFKSLTGFEYLPKKESLWTNLLLANRDGRLFIVFLSGILNLPLIGLAILSFNSHFLTFLRLIQFLKKNEKN